MTIDLLPPRAEWYDNYLSGLTKKSKHMPYYLSVHLVALAELGCNVWQRRKQRDLEAQSAKRRQAWIDQAKAAAAAAQPGSPSPRVAIVTACRSVKKGAEAVKTIEEETGIKGTVSVMALDLSSFESIKAFSVEFKLLGLGLDVLVNNAGLMDIPFTLTKDGFESQFGVNHLGHYKLTLELLPLLHRSTQGRIIVLSSAAMYPSQGIPYSTLNVSKKTGYSRLGHYSHSKLANMLFVKALKRRLDTAGSKVTVNAVHPGTCRTDIFSGNPVTKVATAVIKPMMRTPQEGAMGSIYLALAPELENISGEYFFDQAPRVPSSFALDEEEQEMLWSKSVEFTGIDFML
ncbi:hypothetical protein BGW39_000896 [Mortierella sp. 14UC]|nr:hypothetical protein BGW39_000896 [Mortierella sp. 14UC]